MCDDPSFLPWSRRRNSKGQPKKEVAPDLECASPELSQGYRILQDIIGISKFFLEQPNRREKGMRDYYDVISSPISFREMQQKFARGEYNKISEFVKDVRCLLLNCYTYFGPRHVHTKRALKVEHVLEKELSKLPMDLRSQCSLESTHGIKDAGEMKDAGDVQSQLLQSVIGERSRRERERKLRLSEERRKEKEGRERDLLLWEQEKLFTDLNRRNMECMWELPVIGHFVALLLEQLNISNISMFELERIILMPQASKSLAALMTTLLSTPQLRVKLHTKPPMPYKIWTRKLEFKVSSWYKIFVKSDKNPDIVFEKLGIEHQFWKIMGDWNPLMEYEFHELTFHQRVLLIKALCDYIMQNHKNLRETIAEKRDDFGICLGEDRSRAKFLYFPQFLDHDVRIYRQASKPKSWIDRDMDHQAQILAENVKNVPAKCEKSDVTSMSKRYRKKSAWQRGKIVKHQKCLHPKGTKGLPKTSCKSPRSESNHATESSVPDSAAGVNENCVDKGDSRLLCNVNPGPHDEDVCEEKQNEHSSHTDKNLETGELETSAVLNVDSGSKVSNCKRENVDMELSSNLTTLSVDFCASISESQFEKCSDDLEFTLCCHLRPKQQCTDCDMTVEPSLDDSDKNDFTVKDDEGDNVEKVSLNQTKGVDQDIKNCVLETQKTRRPLYNPYWLEPNPDDFKLVADSLEGVRQLLTKYCDDDVVLIKRFDEKSQKGCRPSCEVRLARRLASIMSDLHSLELKIVTNTKQTREKLYKEWQDFENRSAEYADPDEAFWLNEKDPPEIPETQAYQNSEILDAANLPQTPATDPGDASEDPQQTSSNGMKLRNRRLEDSISRDKFPQLVASEESSEDDSDESDNWVMPKSSTKRKINNPAARSKKKHTSEEQMPQQPPLKCDESSSHMAANSSPEIEVLGGQKVTGRKYSTLPAATLRIKKRLFSQDEASHSEANRQLEWEKNRQTLVNSAANKVAELQQPITYIVENKNKIILDARGKMTVVPIDNKAKTMETTSQNPTSTVVLQGSVRVSTATSVQQSPSSGLHQRRINKISGNRRVFEPVRRVISDVIFVSDDSENSDVEFIETVYNPKLDETLRKKVADLRHERRKLKTQNRCSTKDNTVSDAQADTSRVKPVTSTCNSVTALPNQFQTGISTPQTSAARPVPNATTPQNKVGRQHAATRVQLEMHSVSQNADSRNETLQKQVIVQPGGNAGSILRTDESQTRSTRHIQRPNPRPAADTNSSPHSPSSTKSDKNIYLDDSGVALGTITHAQKFNSISNAKDDVGIRSESQFLPSGVPLSPSLSHKHLVTETNPGASVTRAALPADSFTHSIRPDISVTKRVSPVCKSNSLSQIPGSPLTPKRYPGAPVYQTTNPCSPVAQTSGPGTPVAQRRIPGTPAYARSPDTPTGTPVIQRKSPATPAAQANSPVSPVAQTRIPSSPRVYTRSPGTTVSKVKSRGSPVAQMSPGSVHFTQTKSPDTSLVQPRSSGANLSQSRGNQSSGPERAPSDTQQQLNRAPARLVVVPGDENVSKYALVLRGGAKVILTPEQVADIRAANGGLLPTNVGL